MHQRKTKRSALLAAGLLAIAMRTGIARADNSHSKYSVTNLVSDVTVTPPATTPDASLQNAWGIAYLPGGPIWINANGSGTSRLYDGAGAIFTALPFVNVPGPSSANGAPTGIVANGNAFLFAIPQHTAFSAQFIFSTEDGVIDAWNLGLDPNNAVVAVDNSGSGAVYKGLAMGNTSKGEFLYATDFHGAKIDVIDATFAAVPMPAGAFTDTKIPGGPSCDSTKATCFAPFGIANIRGNLFVSYAVQDSAKHDDVKGKGNGFVDVFDTSGNLISRFASKGKLNSPWGMVEAPWNFGGASGSILVGNFGDGAINVFSSTNGSPRGQLMDSGKKPLTIDGLWGLTFGGFQGSDPGTLYFTAGPNDEANGLYGSIDPQ